MSQEIIEVLNYIGDQIGVAIDWTSDNIWPQVMDILERYRLFEIIGKSLWIIGEIGAIVFALIVFIKSVKSWININKSQENNFWWYKGYCGNYCTGVGFALMVVAAIFGFSSLFLIPIEVGELLKWLIIPEIEYLEMLKGFMS